MAEHLIWAKALGQKNLLNQPAFSHDVIVREMKLLAAGITRFVDQDDVKNLLDKKLCQDPNFALLLSEFRRLY